MKVILSMAVSINGFIADENGSEDFLSHENWIAFIKLAKRTGNNIWGRKTYEVVKTWQKNYLDDLKNVNKVVISTDKDIQLLSDFTLVNSPKMAIDYLSKQGYMEILVTGGSSIYSTFLREKLVDEIIFDIDPTLISRGIRGFVFDGLPITLELLDIEKLPEGIVELHYRVNK